MTSGEFKDQLEGGRLLTVAEAAAFLQVTTKTVYRHIREGRLRSVKVGPRLLRIPAQEFSAFLRNKIEDRLR